MFSATTFLFVQSNDVIFLLLLVIFVLLMLIFFGLKDQSLTDYYQDIVRPKGNYTEDIFWNAIIRWNWKKEEKTLVLDTNTIEKICPKCQHNMRILNQDKYYFLFCDSCKFISTEFFEGTLPQGVDAKQQFNRALESEISASLRKQGMD